MTIEKEILAYMLSEYHKTKFNYFYLVELTNRFGNIRNELNSLFQSGYIAKRTGINGTLIELIKTE